MNKELTVRRLEQAIEFSLIGLLIILPVAHVTAVRSFLVVFPAVLWIAKMILTKNLNIRTPVDIPILLFTVTVAGSVLFAISPAEALKEIKGELFTYLLIFYMTANIIRREDQIQRFALMLCSWIIVFAVYGVIKFYIEGGKIDSLAVRLTSLARGCTNYADYIVLTFPLATYGALRLKGKQTLIGGLAVALALITLFFTHSRAGWIAVALEILLISYFMLRQRVLTVALIAGMTAIVWVLPQNVLSHGVKDGLRYETREEALLNGTESVRMYQWSNGIKEMLNHPFKGFGYGRSNYVSGMQAAGPGTLDVSSCNAFLDAWLQLGVHGMLALLFIFFTLAAAFFNNARKVTYKEHLKTLMICGFVSVTGYFVINQFEGSYVDEMAMTFWLLMGVYVGCSKFQVNRIGYSKEI